jgi:hypothetical protein
MREFVDFACRASFGVANEGTHTGWRRAATCLEHVQLFDLLRQLSPTTGDSGPVLRHC